MIEIRHVDNTQNAYNNIYDNEGILLRDSFYLWLIDLLTPQTGRTLIDVSCGEGRLVTFAQAQGLHAIGIDFAVSGVEKGYSETRDAGWSVGDGEKLPFTSKSADYVTHIGSLEHYHHPEQGMQEIRRILKADGLACILLPNTFGLLGNIKHVLQTGDVFDDGQPLQRYNTRQGWHNLLVKNGLEPIYTTRYERERPYTFRDLMWYIAHPAKLIRLGISPLIPVNFANCIVYVCKPIT